MNVERLRADSIVRGFEALAPHPGTLGTGYSSCADWQIGVCEEKPSRNVWIPCRHILAGVEDIA